MLPCCSTRASTDLSIPLIFLLVVRRINLTDLYGCNIHMGPSLVAQAVKNLPSIQENLVQPLNWKIAWRKSWQSTPVLLPGKSHGQKNLMGYSPWGLKESGMTEWLSAGVRVRTHTHTHLYRYLWRQVEQSEWNKLYTLLQFRCSSPSHTSEYEEICR